MSTPVLILGKSGTGKSRAIKTLDPKQTVLINVLDKDLPFKGWKKGYSTENKNYLHTDNYESILNAFKKVADRKDVKTVIVDDFQYVMGNEFVHRSKEKGYDKFTEIAAHAWEIIWQSRFVGEDKIVIFLSHTDTNDMGEIKAKTIGKMLDEKIGVEGMFTIILHSICEDGKYLFETNKSNSLSPAKSPEEMFSAIKIPNDLKLVVDSINNYYGG
jgi:hypothetical protein